MREMKDIEDLFAANFGGETVTPPADVKTNIDKALFGTKKVGFIRFWPVLLLFLIGTTTGAYFLLKGDGKQVNQQVAEFDEENRGVNNNTFNSEPGKPGNEGSGSSVLGNSEASDEVESTAINTSNSGGDAQANQTNGANSTFDQSSNSTSDNKRFSPSGNSDRNSAQNDGNSNDKFLAKSGVDRERNNQSDKNDLTQSKKSDKNNKDNSEQVSENRGMEITSNMETKTVNVIESPLKGIEKGTFVGPKTNDNSNPLMSLRLYIGGANGIGPVNYTVDSLMAQKTQVSESNGFNVAAEWGYNFNPRFGLSTGFEYFGNSAEVIETTTVTMQDTTVINEYWEYVYNNPVTQDSIIDSNYIYVYAQYDTDITNTSIVKTSAFTLPLYFNFSQRIGRSLDLSVHAGMRFTYLKQMFLDENGAMMNPDLKNFSMSFMLRPELTYNWSRFGIGVYGKVGFDAINGMQWTTKKRNRYEVGGGLVLKYHL